jgi:Arc/MetJ family transcription regulator
MCMRTNIDIDENLIAEAARLTGIKTKKELVHQALKVLIESKKRRSLLELAGKIEFDPDYDYKAAREAD